MTNKRRGIFVGVVLAAMATASLAAAVTALIKRLPEPETADRRGLFRWLIECDLREQPWDLRLRIVNRIEQELLAGIDLREVAAMLNADQCRQMLANGDELARCWFIREANRYASERQDRRTALLGQQIEQFRRLGILDQLTAVEQWVSRDSTDRGPAAGTGSPPASAATSLPPSPELSAMAAFAASTKRIEHWLAATIPSERTRLVDFFAAIRNRMVSDTLRGWLPG